jgi:Xaa-Pro aminopeptidase
MALPSMEPIIAEKLAQASRLVAASEFDAWVLFVRETAEQSDPVLPLVLEGGLTWQSALIFMRDGTRIAIVGNYDADPLIKSGHWNSVVPYVQSIREPLVEAMQGITPNNGALKLALNYSTNDDKADGLTHGMFLLLQEYLRELTVVFVSAEELAMSLRGIKSAEEVRRIRGAIKDTDWLFGEIGRFAKVGVSEKEIYDHVHALVRDLGLGFSWDPAGDPIVNSGPNSMIGHGIPSASITLQEGHVFHVDLGVVKAGYSSDLQRCWYLGSSVPDDVQKALDSVNRAISAAADALKPGAFGYAVDEAARNSLIGDGYEEYMHATGHQVGRVAHDGGTTLGPRWERYGSSPYNEVKEGEVYTLELGVVLPGRGYLGIEEMVRVTAQGCEWLSERQLTMPCL